MSQGTLSTDEKLDKVLRYLNEKYTEAHKITITEFENGSSVTSIPPGFKTGAYREDMEIYGAIRKEYMEDLFAQIPLILTFLRDEGYVTEHSEPHWGHKVKYRITFKGINFIENGGYRKKNRKDKLKFFFEEWAKYLFWVPLIISAISTYFAGANYYRNAAKIDDVNRRLDSFVVRMPVMSIDKNTIIQSKK